MFSGTGQINSVDIEGDDGVVRYGRVVDVTDSGFYVDLLSTEGRRFFPFGSNVFLPSTVPSPVCGGLANEYAKPDLTIPVEVLMRETPNGPWRWYPAEMVNLTRGAQYESYNVAVVHWGAAAARTDIVLGEQIRLRDPSHGGTAAAGRRIEKETFAKAGMPLPKAYCSLSAKELRRLMPSYWLDCAGLWLWSFAFVDIVDDHLWYIERPREKCAASGNVLDELWDFSPATLHSNLLDRFERTIRPRSTATLELENQEPHDVLTVLSGEVWLEVFSHLGTLPRTLLQTVCQTFVCLLESPTLSADIFITTADCNQMENYDRRDYFIIAPIYQYLSSSTKRILVADRKGLLSDSDIWKVLDMIHYVAEHRPPLRRLALYLHGFRCHFELGLTFDPEMGHGNCVLHGPKPLQQKFNGYTDASDDIRLDDFVAAYQKLPCDAIRLINCTMHANVWPNTLHPLEIISVSLTQLEKPSNLECTVWEALEASLPVPTLDQRQMVSQLLTKLANAAEGDPLMSFVCKVLCVTQAADPRETLHYRGKKWCMDGLKDVQVDSLSRIAVHALVRLVEIGTG